MIGDDKLYVRVRCSVCFGTKNNRNNGICPYCDMEAKQYIEATYEHTTEQVLKWDKEEKIKLYDLLKEQIE